MASIGKLALQLTANPAGFMTAMQQATNSVNKFSRSAANPNTWIRGINTGFSKLGGAISGIVAPIQQLVSSIPLVGPALGGIIGQLTNVHGIFEAFKEGSQRVLDVGMAARKLGVDIEWYSGIAQTAGVPTDDLTKGLLRLSKTMGEARMGNQEAIATFGRLGISADNLSHMQLPDMLGTVMDKVKGLGDGTLQTTAAFDLLSRHGINMVQFLRRGKEGLDQATDAAKKAGLTFNGVEYQGVLQATLALKQLDRWVMAVKQQIAIQFAPAILALSDELGSMGVSAKMVGETIMAVFKGGAYIVAGFIETMKGLGMVWDTLLIGFRVMAAGIVTGLQKLMEQGAKLPGIMGGDEFRKAAESLKETSTEMWSDLDRDRDKFLEGMSGKSAFRQVDDFFERVRQKTEKIAADMKKAAAGTGEMTDAARQFELFDRGQKLGKELASPLDKFYDRLKEINELVAGGAISWDTYGLALTKAFDELEKSQAKIDVKAPAALEFGSKEAYSRIAEAQRQGVGPQSVQERMASTLKQQMALQQQQLQVGRDMVQALLAVVKTGV